MFGRRSDEERLFEEIDKLDAEVSRTKAQGPDSTAIEEFARTLRMTSYSYKGLFGRTTIEVVDSHDPAVSSEWSKLWEEMKEGKLHPREPKAFCDRLRERREWVSDVLVVNPS